MSEPWNVSECFHDSILGLDLIDLLVSDEGLIRTIMSKNKSNRLAKN